MVLEPPSDTTLLTKQKVRGLNMYMRYAILNALQNEEEALKPSGSDLALIPKAEELKKKRKGPKGPNPLSVKKKKVPPPSQARKRKREDEEEDKPQQGAGEDHADPQETSQPRSGRKRKRRRNGAAVPNDSTAPGSPGEAD